MHSILPLHLYGLKWIFTSTEIVLDCKHVPNKVANEFSSILQYRGVA